MKISDRLLYFAFGYLPSIMALILVAYFFRLIFYYDINPYTYWFFTFFTAVSSSISIYKYRNRPLKKLQETEIDKKISINDWLSLIFFAGIGAGGAYIMQTISKQSDCSIKNISLGISLIVLSFGIQCFFEKARSLKLMDKCKQSLKQLLKKN